MRRSPVDLQSHGRLSLDAHLCFRFALYYFPLYKSPCDQSCEISVLRRLKGGKVNEPTAERD